MATVLPVSTDDLQKRIERLGNRLLVDIETWEARQPVAPAPVQSQPLSRREEKKARRDALRAEKRKEEIDNASVPAAVISLIVAFACFSFAMSNPHLWWIIFVGFGFASTGARQLTHARRRAGATLPGSQNVVQRLESQAAPNDIDPLCDRLLSDLKASPEAVRAFVVNPEQTIESLRSTCHALAARRQQLAGERALERITDVERQKRDLTLRRDAAGDEMARQKLTGALGSLDAQVTALRQLGAAYERVDGEYTSLLVTLQELRTRISLAKSAGSSVQLEGLKQSVTRLGAELEAITGALESAPSQQAVAPVGEADSAAPSERVRS